MFSLIPRKNKFQYLTKPDECLKNTVGPKLQLVYCLHRIATNMFGPQPSQKCSRWTLIICFMLTLTVCILVIWLLRRPECQARVEEAYLNFPEGFSIGAGGSSYQTEGAWNISGKGENTLDRLTHTKPWEFANRSNGDVTCDSYHKYKEDVQWIKKLGLDHYRLSISWSRVLPTGLPDSVNREGLQFYHNLIDELVANDIEPVVTLFHWDLPVVLEDMGGWTNDSMVTWFTDYADIIFRELGPKVKVFTTLNEPEVYCFVTYANGNYSANMRGNFLCGNIVLKAHARAYHLYDMRYRPSQNGKIGITTDCEAYFPKNPNDSLASEIGFQMECGRYAHAIYIGDYSDVYKARITQYNRNASLATRVPELSSEWIEHIKGTADYFGLNHYGSMVVELTKGAAPGKGHLRSFGVTTSIDPSWEISVNGRRPIVPQGFGYILRKIKKEYNNPPVYILENGIAEGDPVNDFVRVRYLHSYLKELLLAVNRDGCNVQMYTTWSLMDNFEWTFGYELQPMGLISVNFSSPNRDRSPKSSFFWLQNVIHNRRLQPPILPFNKSIEHLPQPLST